MAQQDEQLNRMAYDQEILRRRVEQQRYQKPETVPSSLLFKQEKQPTAREREKDALGLLGAFERLNVNLKIDNLINLNMLGE